MWYNMVKVTKGEKLMIKLVKSLVDDKHVLVGFIIQGKEREFGGMTDVEVARSIPLQSLRQSSFKNNQIKIERGSIVELGQFRVNTLPMGKIIGNDIIDMDNSITITKRFMMDNENIGFAVQFGDGETLNVRYEALLNYAVWFKPSNFVVRTVGSRQFIAGKPGVMRLEDLPCEVIGDAPTRKTAKSGAKDKDKKISKATQAQVGTGIDIISFYDWIMKNHGAYLHLEGTPYVAKTVEKVKTDQEQLFMPLKVSEVCTSALQFNPQNLKVNAPFKKAGIVNVQISGQNIPVVTYLDRTKSLFIGGRDYIHQFGIAIPQSVENELINNFGPSLALTKLSDEALIKSLNQVINSSETLIYYIVDAKNIDMVAKDKIPRVVKSAKSLYQLVLDLNDCKVISKCFSNRGKFMKQLKAELGDMEAADAVSKKPVGIFAMMNEADLARVIDMGFNPYTGGFNPPATDTKKKSSNKNEEITIEYSIAGKTISSETGDKLIEMAKSGDTSKMSPQVLADILKVISISDAKERYAKATETAKKYEHTQRELEKALWLHNTAMVILGNGRVIHTRDYSKWELDEKGTARVKAGQVFRCNEADCEGLAVKFTGVSFAK